MAVIQCLECIASVGCMVHVQGGRAVKARSLVGGDIGMQVALGDDLLITRNVRSDALSAEPASISANLGRHRRLAFPIGIARTKQRLEGCCDVRLHGAGGFLEMLFVEALVLPVAERIFVLRVQIAVDQPDEHIKSPLERGIGYAQVGDREATVRMVAGDVPDDHRSPIVPYPDRLFLTEGVEQLDHVGDEFALGVGVVRAVERGPSMPPQVRCDRPKAERTEDWKLMPPAQCKFWPAMDEDDRRALARAACKIESAVA